MVSEQEYQQAQADKERAQEIINTYFKEKAEAFAARLSNDPIFMEEELRFSARTRCACGAGIAYPKSCGPFHYWDCSAILMGIADPTIEHSPRMAFLFYDVKSESEYGGTTRPSGIPKEY